MERTSARSQSVADATSAVCGEEASVSLHDHRNYCQPILVGRTRVPLVARASRAGEARPSAGATSTNWRLKRRYAECVRRAGGAG